MHFKAVSTWNLAFKAEFRNFSFQSFQILKFKMIYMKDSVYVTSQKNLDKWTLTLLGLFKLILKYIG